MIHNIKHIHELFRESHLEEIKEVAKYADRLGLQDAADKIFALHFVVKKSLVKANTIYIGLKKIIKTIEIAALAEENEEKISTPDEISEMRFEKAMPIRPLNAVSPAAAETPWEDKEYAG